MHVITESYMSYIRGEAMAGIVWVLYWGFEAPLGGSK
jgi:hypothetical protein